MGTGDLGLHIEAVCQECGTWHSANIHPHPSQADAKPIIEAQPVCWNCGTGLLIVQQSPQGEVVVLRKGK